MLSLHNVRDIQDCCFASADHSIADNKIVFSDYPKLYREGKIAKIPKMIGTTAREFSALLPYPVHNATAGPSPQLITEDTLKVVCAAYNTSVFREKDNLVTYRYQWAGNFSNISPVSWLGAYHYSDLYMFFGTYLIAPGAIPELEVRTSERMQDLLYDFVADPLSLPTKGWPEFEAESKTGGKLTRFGADGEVLQVVDGNAVDGACHIPGDTYNTTP